MAGKNNDARGDVVVGLVGMSSWGSWGCRRGARGDVVVGLVGMSSWGSWGCRRGARGDVVAPGSVEATSMTIADIHAPPRQHTPEPPSVAETSGTPRRQPSITNDHATDAITNVQSPWDIRPIPFAQRLLSKRKTSRMSSTILTSSPMKDALETKARERRTLEDQKLQRRKEREKKSEVKRQLTLV